MLPDIHNIELSSFRGLFPGILFKKLSQSGIITVDQFLQTGTSQFSRQPGVGKKVLSLFSLYKAKIENEPSVFYDYHIRAVSCRQLPSNTAVLSSYNFLSLFKHIVLDYLTLPGNIHLRDQLLQAYGIDTTKQTRRQIASLNRCTVETIRLHHASFVSRVGLLLQGKCLGDPGVKLADTAFHHFQSVIFRLRLNPVHNLDSISFLLVSEFQVPPEDIPSGILSLFLDCIPLFECRPVTSVLKGMPFFVTEKSNRLHFLKIAPLITSCFRSTAILFSESQLISFVQQGYKQADPVFIRYILELWPGIESFQLSGHVYYQIKFGELQYFGNYAFRILSESGKPMHLGHILFQVNTRLSLLGISRRFQRDKVHLASDKRFRSFLKTGYWALQHWPADMLSLSFLVTNALATLKRPASCSEILSSVLYHRPLAKSNSIMALISRNCLPLSNGMYILPAWKPLYISLLQTRIKRRSNVKHPHHHVFARQQIIQLLLPRRSHRLPAGTLVSSITSTFPHISKQLLYYIFSDTDYFLKTLDKKGKLHIKLIPSFFQSVTK